MKTFAVLALVAALATPALAETVTYTAALKGADEVPPNDTKGTGTVLATYDTATMKFSYTVTYSGLTGAATAAHFHGPAKPGANAGPIITLDKLSSPIVGQATLTAEQAQAARRRALVPERAHRGAPAGGDPRPAHEEVSAP